MWTLMYISPPDHNSPGSNGQEWLQRLSPGLEVIFLGILPRLRDHASTGSFVRAVNRLMDFGPGSVFGAESTVPFFPLLLAGNAKSALVPVHCG